VTTLAQALAQPGNRIVEVNAHHNSQFVGNVNTNPVTTGLYQGYLIVKAQGCDPENGIYPWNIDARTVRFHLQGSTRRLIFWGFNVLGEIDDDGADVWWWYCKLSHPADRATLPSWSSPLYQSPDCLDLTDAVRPRVHGCTFSDWAHAIQGGATTLDSRGCEFFNPYNSVASKWNTHALFVPNGGLSGSLTDFFVDDRYPHASYTLDNNTGRGLELVGDPASKGAIDLTLSRGWVKSSFGDAVTLSGDPSAAVTLRYDPSVRLYGQTDATAIGNNAINTHTLGSYTPTAPSVGTTTPAQAWRAANPSESLLDFAFGIRTFDDDVCALSWGFNWTLGANGYTPQGWLNIFPPTAQKLLIDDGFMARVRHGIYTGNTSDYDFAKLVLDKIILAGGKGVLFGIETGWPGMNANGQFVRDDTAAHAVSDGALLHDAMAALSVAMRTYVKQALGTTAGNAFDISYEGKNESSRDVGFTIKRDMLRHSFMYAGLKAGDPLCRVAPSTTIITGSLNTGANPNRSNVLHETATGGQDSWLPYDQWVDRCNPAMCGSISGFGAVPTLLDTGFDHVTDHDYDSTGSPNGRPPTNNRFGYPYPGGGTTKYPTYIELEAACNAYAAHEAGLGRSTSIDPLRWNHTRWVPWIAMKLYDLDVAHGTAPAVAAARCVVSTSEVGWQASSFRNDVRYPLDFAVVDGNAGKFRVLNPVVAGQGRPSADTGNARWCPEWSGGGVYTVGKRVWNANAFWQCSSNVGPVPGDHNPPNDLGHWTKIRNSKPFAEGVDSWISEEQQADSYVRYFRQWFGFDPTIDGIWMGGPNAVNLNAGGAKAQRNLNDCMYPYEASDIPGGESNFGFLYWGTRQDVDRSALGLGEKGAPTASDGAYRLLLSGYVNRPDPRRQTAAPAKPGKISSVVADNSIANRIGLGWNNPTNLGNPPLSASNVMYEIVLDGTTTYHTTQRLFEIQPVSAGTHSVTVAASNQNGAAGSYGTPSDPLSVTVFAAAPQDPTQPPAPSVDTSGANQVGFLATDPPNNGNPPTINKFRWKIDGVEVGQTDVRLVIFPAAPGAHTGQVAVSNNGGASWSPDSPTVNFTTLASPPSPTADDPPTSVVATAGDGTVHVDWQPFPEPDVTAQRVTPSTGATPTVVSNDVSSADFNSPNGVTLTVTVARAVPDVNNNGVQVWGAESAPSNPVTPMPEIPTGNPTIWGRVGRLKAGV
jgi:hypothetical protein